MAKSIANVQFEACPTDGGPDWMVLVTFPDAPEMIAPNFALEADARDRITTTRENGYGGSGTDMTGPASAHATRGDKPQLRRSQPTWR